MGILRLVLAVVVLLYHCPLGVIPRFLHSGLAVQCFYVISGFLIQLVIRKYSEAGKGWQWSFYQSRLLRLMPLYWLFAALTLLLFGSKIFPILWQIGSVKAMAIYIFNNLFIVGQDLLRLVTFDGLSNEFAFIPPEVVKNIDLMNNHVLLGSSFSLLGQSWSLAVELMFYLVAPFILLRRTPVVLAVVAASVAFRLWLTSYGYRFNFYIHGIILNELAVFLFGSLMCRAYFFFLKAGRVQRFGERFLSAVAVDRAIMVAGVALLGALIYYYVRGWHSFPQGGGWDQGRFGVPYGWWGVIFFTGLSLPLLFHSMGRWDRFIGDLSYPLYISHMLFAALSAKAGVAEEWQGAVTLAVSLAASVLMLIYIDRPVDRLRHHLFLRKKNAQEAKVAYETVAA